MAKKKGNHPNLLKQKNHALKKVKEIINYSLRGGKKKANNMSTIQESMIFSTTTLTTTKKKERKEAQIKKEKRI